MNANQNNNQITTIRRLRDNTQISIILPTNRNSRFISRTFILHDDGQTYDYVHEYADKRPSTHNGKVSRRIWNKLNRLLENALETQLEEDDWDFTEDNLYGMVIGTLWNLLRNPEEMDPEIFDNAVENIFNSIQTPLPNGVIRRSELNNIVQNYINENLL